MIATKYKRHTILYTIRRNPNVVIDLYKVHGPLDLLNTLIDLG